VHGRCHSFPESGVGEGRENRHGGSRSVCIPTHDDEAVMDGVSGAKVLSLSGEL
jgi:hypothetical protein